MLTLDDVNNFIDSFEASGLQISSVAAQTGTGKSTMFPQGFYHRSKTIFVVQPTIAAATGIAGYVATKIPEYAVGTAVEGNVNYKNRKLYFRDSETTPVVFCTAGHLRNILLKFAEESKGKAFVDYIFLDEAHTGDLIYDGIMYVYEYLRKNSIEVPKLILITATPGIYPFSEDLVYKASYSAKSYPVEIFYHTRDYPNLKGKDYQSLFSDVVDVVVNAHENNPLDFDMIDAWLVFCPGKNEIRQVVDSLREQTKNTIIVPTYSGSERETNMQHDMVPPLGFRKIVVATNVAEASITIEGLSFVFDTLVEKITVQNKNGMTMLMPTNISKISAQQRKGRSGRTRPGKCYRMCTEKYFEKELVDIRPREIERIAPDGLVLDLMARHLEIEEIVTDGAISTSTLRETKSRLSTIGLVNDLHTGVTLAGDWIKRTPLSPRSGMFFWLWNVYSEFNTYIGAIFTAILETHGGGYFYVSDTDPPIEKIIKDKLPEVLTSFKGAVSKTAFYFNVALILHIIKFFRKINIGSFELKVFCADHNLNNAKIKECLKLIKLLCERFGRYPMEIGVFDIDLELRKAERFLYQCFSDQVYQMKHSKRQKIKTEIDSFLGNRDQISDKTYIIPLSSFETDFRTFVSMYHLTDSKPTFKIAPEK